jgi:tetratricopeptide (TPR) repeat protein
MRRLAIVLMLAMAACGSAFAQSNETPPAVCTDATTTQNWQPCYDATAPHSNWRMLAAINLGSQAFLRSDFAAAVRFYDEGRPPRPAVIYSDVAFHAFRASAYEHVGRTADALEDANIALRMLHRDPSIPAEPSNYFPPTILPSAIYEMILPVLKHGERASFQTALSEYLAFPAYEWTDYANRAAILEEAGEYDRALGESAHALAMAPGEAGVQNNHCAILYDLHRYSEALPYCEAAVRIDPGIAGSRDSLSDVFAALGRCADAEREHAEAVRLDPTNVALRDPVVCPGHAGANH